jgi:hypothetical protein
MTKIILNKLKDKSGMSIVFVVIISVIFLIIGASVLTAASVSAGASIKARDNKQLYYYAKSAGDAINKSVKDNSGIGTEIVDLITELLIEDREIPATLTLNSYINLQDVNGFNLPDLIDDNVIVKLTGIHCEKEQNYVKNGNYYDITESYRIRVSKVVISFKTNYKSLEYRMNLEYGFSAIGQRIGSVYTEGPVNSIADLDLSVLPKQVIWLTNNRTLLRVFQE